MITFENISALLFLPVVVFSALFSLFYFGKIQKSIHCLKNNSGEQNPALLKRRFTARVILWAVSACCLVIAYSGPYIGTRARPVQTNGNSVSLVFDISFSMTANDMPSITDNNTTSTRIKYMSAYASQLLSRFAATPVSVILAKGSGVLAVPSTNDYTAIYSLLQSLSPYMLSSIGSDLGSGIAKAVTSFPVQIANDSTIILFTDGDETTYSLQQAVTEAVKYGIKVIIIGVGSKNETEITAGDGTSSIKTALREQNLQTIAESSDSVTYINALDIGSALQTVRLTQKAVLNPTAEQSSFRQEPYPRFMLFLIIALISFLLGVLVIELHIPFKTGKNISFFLIMIVFTSCSDSMTPSFKILNGVFSWNQNKYSNAVTLFTEAKTAAQAQEDADAQAFADFALSTTYLAQNELEAAKERLQSIPTTVSDNIHFGIWYNSGIIAHREGNYTLAAEHFKKALIINPSSVDAKINLELSKQEKQAAPPQQGTQESIPVNESQQESAAEQTIYSIIRKKEANVWKSQENQNTVQGGLDH